MNPFRKTRLFFGELIGELKKTAWPSKAELKESTIVVLIGIALLGVFVGSVDFSLFQVVNLFIRWLG